MVCQPVQLYMYLYLDVSRRAYDGRVGGGDADAMQLNVEVESREKMSFRV